jgi:hypothetical protein
VTGQRADLMSFRRIGALGPRAAAPAEADAATDRALVAHATALELIPCQRVRPSASYFAAGHRLLDSLTCPLPVRVAVQQRPDQDNRRAAVSSDGPAPSRP